MSWRLADAKDRVRLRRFVESREPGTVVFSEHLQRNGAKPSRFQRVHLYERGDRIESALLQTGAGFFVPAAPGESFPEPRKLRDLIDPEGNRIHSIMGELPSVHSLAETIGVPLSFTVDYHLMHRPREQRLPFVEPPLPGLNYAWATVRDAKQLREVQEAYEREEVLLPGHGFNPRVSMENLRYHLRNQLVLYATYQGEVIAKAATNARGFGCDQLGGVYTKPEFRRRGIARWLVAILIRRIRKEMKGSSLFVKPANLPAVELYRDLGFSIVGPFRISYY
ncbi:MAG: GNAT family N-acetyltransferase [Alkalispirochaetaceae bacterium]